jgi:branched-chain amino acid transport system ATP-binding protein
MSDSEVALRATSISVRYGGVTANDEVSLSVGAGEVVGLIGPNGAGKTTFVDAVTGFAKYTGTVSVGGRALDGLPAHKRRQLGLARTWQGGELFHSMTVKQNVLTAADTGGIRGLLSDLGGRKGAAYAAQEDVLTALDVLGLSDMTDVRTDRLSLGQQRLVGVARSLVSHPKVLLLDEPAAGLDTRESDHLAEIFPVITGLGIGILLIEHDMHLVFGACKRVCVLEFGKIIASDDAAAVRSMPAVRRAYLGDAAALEEA